MARSHDPNRAPLCREVFNGMLADKVKIAPNPAALPRATGRHRPAGAHFHGLALRMELTPATAAWCPGVESRCYPRTDRKIGGIGPPRDALRRRVNVLLHRNSRCAFVRHSRMWRGCDALPTKRARVRRSPVALHDARFMTSMNGRKPTDLIERICVRSCALSALRMNAILLEPPELRTCCGCSAPNL
jgi:hypothetical protein